MTKIRTSGRLIALLASLACALPALAAIDIDWYSLDCGGTSSSTSSSFELSGTIAQVDAGSTMTSPTFELTGGFWVVGSAGGMPEPCDGDANGDFTVDPLDAGYVLARFGCSVGTGDAGCDAADQH